VTNLTGQKNLSSRYLCALASSCVLLVSSNRARRTSQPSL